MAIASSIFMFLFRRLFSRSKCSCVGSPLPSNKNVMSIFSALFSALFSPAHSSAYHDLPTCCHSGDLTAGAPPSAPAAGTAALGNGVSWITGQRTLRRQRWSTISNALPRFLDPSSPSTTSSPQPTGLPAPTASPPLPAAGLNSASPASGPAPLCHPIRSAASKRATSGDGAGNVRFTRGVAIPPPSPPLAPRMRPLRPLLHL